MRLMITVLALFIGLFAFGNQGDGGWPKASMEQVMSLSSTQFAQPDIQKLRLEDEENERTKVGPWRFGFNNEVALNMSNSGTWFDLSDGSKVWLLKVTCQEALTVNLTLKNVEIPEGNSIMVYNEKQTQVLGAFTAKHLYQGQLGTDLIDGSSAIIEYHVASGNAVESTALEVEKVTHGYRTSQEFQNKAFGTSGNCNMNAACDDGANWQEQIRSAIMLVSNGNGFCSGAMINNTANDGTPYVLTANHCYSNPASWVFRFNWQSETCNNPSSSPSYESLSGATLRARSYNSDFCLVEITGGLENGTVPTSYNTYFAGWNRRDEVGTASVGVHHPDGDIKKISFDDDAYVSANGMSSPVDDTQWEVVWDRNTTTEGGSSGSPLFDQDGLIIGQLWGGGASCWNLSAPDFYGKLSYSWESNGSQSNKQLKPWLDPSNSGVETLNGFDPVASVASIESINIDVYPNPNNGNFTVQTSEKIESVELMSVSGQAVSVQLVKKANAVHVSTLGLSEGVYILKVTSSEGTGIQKIYID